MRITRVDAWEALDSRGRPTVAARVVLDDGAEGVALVPSGASAGSHEAVELRDGGARYGGRGVRGAVDNVRDVLAPRIVGLAPDEVDPVIADADSSPRFASIGANAALAVSLAALRADAAAHGRTLARHLNPRGPLLLPMPMVNIVSGGAHAGRMIDVQDFLVIPLAATSFAEAIEWSAAVREAATAIALSQGHAHAALVADEGGLGLSLATNRGALDLVTAAIEAAGFVPGEQVAIAIDIAATQFFHGGRYHLTTEGRVLSAEDLVAEIVDWCDSYPIVSVEDAVAEDDWDGWKVVTAALGERVELVGDDLFVTDSGRLARGIDAGVANSVLVKVNQNGLVSGAAAVMAMAKANGYRTVVSARSGETEDSWLADLAVGWSAGQIKVGSTHRSERTAKWNRLLELEATEQTVFAGPWTGGRATERNAS